MPVTVCWAAKGGSGTTVVAAILALSRRTDSLLVDLDGQLPLVLGVSEPAGQGVADWLTSDAPPAALGHLAIDVDRTTRLVPRGSSPIEHHPDRWQQLVEWLATQGAAFVDAGTRPPPPSLVCDSDVRSLLVARNCYVGLRKAIATGCRPDGVVLVAEPGRTLKAADVEGAVGAPVVASVSLDPAIARAVDAGLMANRLPWLLTRQLRGAA